MLREYTRLVDKFCDDEARSPERRCSCVNCIARTTNKGVAQPPPKSVILLVSVLALLLITRDYLVGKRSSANAANAKKVALATLHGDSRQSLRLDRDTLERLIRGSMKHFSRFLLIVTLLALTGPSPAARSTATSSLPNDNWFNGSAGYARAVELQRELKVPIVVYFYADWCGYCRTLDSQYLPSAPVQEYLRGVVKVRINPEHGRPERALADRYGIKGYPSFFVIPYPGTRSPVSVSPFRRVGTLTPTQFANACRSVAPISRKISAARSSEANGELRDRASETVTKQTTTFGGTQIVTVVPATSVWTRRRSRTGQP